VAKYLCKANWNSGQLRITIPKALVESRGWRGVEYLLLDERKGNCVLMWRFIDGESLKKQGMSDKG